ncbi:hypothetical protein MNBD_NITROSPINAE02-1980 [hydrothermal vent metagenome]|uniref:Histidine kinase n=1 Tax=hydrothermal vent metagenome TaxID=652676 RepID=A0A3B1CIC1_9ZZZZ
MNATIDELKKERDTYANALAQSNESFQEKVKEFSIIKRIGESMRWNLDRKKICVELVDIITDETTCENCSLWLVEPGGMFIELVAARGQEDGAAGYYSSGSRNITSVKVNNWAVGWVAATGEPILIEDVTKNKRFSKPGASQKVNIRSLLCLPIKGEQGVIGAVNMSHPDAGAFSKEDERALSFITDQAALAFANLLLFERIQNFNEQLEKKVEERTSELKFSEGKYRSFMVNAGDAILVVESGGRKILEANSRALEYTGYQGEDLAGKDIRFLLGEDIENQFTQALAEGFGRIDSYPLTKSSGETIFVDITVNMISTEAGEMAHLIIRDITHRLKLEEKLKEYSEHLEELVYKRTEELKIAQGELIQASKMAAIGEMASGVVHEINNPMGVIRGYAEELLYRINKISPQNYNVEEILSSLETIVKQADRCQEITDTLLNFSRRQKMTVSAVDINEVIFQVIHFASHKAKEKDVKIINELASNIPTVLTDSCMLEQILLNLYLNAMDAIEDSGKITTTTSFYHSEVKISITDDGTGIAAENLPTIFDPFFTTKVSGQGTGLGLSICTRLIERLQGKITVESKPGEGATFSVTLPLKRTLEESKDI